MEYTIEAMAADGHWYILGGERLSMTAQRYMGDYRRSHPSLPLRVVENPTRKLIVLNDPREAA